MIDEEEKQKYIEATKCENCMGWHKHCNAECCKVVVINMCPEDIDMSLTYLSINPGKKLGMSDIKYYANRDVEYVRGLLRFRTLRLEIVGRKVYYMHPCSRLDGNLCLDHPDKKPEVCKILTLETAQLPGQPFALTSNCLFKYKCKEVKEDD